VKVAIGGGVVASQFDLAQRDVVAARRDPPPRDPENPVVKASAASMSGTRIKRRIKRLFMLQTPRAFHLDKFASRNPQPCYCSSLVSGSPVPGPGILASQAVRVNC
jgi:hypothetical protein